MRVLKILKMIIIKKNVVIKELQFIFNALGIFSEYHEKVVNGTTYYVVKGE